MVFCQKVQYNSILISKTISEIQNKKKKLVLWYQSELMLASFAVFSWAICSYNTPSKEDLLLFCFFSSFFIWPTIADGDDLTNRHAWRTSVILDFRSTLIHRSKRIKNMWKRLGVDYKCCCFISLILLIIIVFLNKKLSWEKNSKKYPTILLLEVIRNLRICNNKKWVKPINCKHKSSISWHNNNIM